MTRSLFRPEALEFQKTCREFGQVGRLQPISTKLLAWLLVVSVGLLVAFICLANYTRKETVSGYLSPQLGTAGIYVPHEGTVTAVHVSQGQLVSKGDILLTIDTTQLTADGKDVNATILASLTSQKTVLANQMESEKRSAQADKDRLSAAIVSGKAELAQLSAQMRFQQDQIAIGQKLVDAAMKMRASGYISAPELLRRQQSLLEAKQALSSLEQRRSARDTELRQTRTALEQLPTDSARRLQPLQSGLAQIQRQIAEVTGRRSFAVRSPISGRVASVQTEVGQIADPKRVQLEILPVDSPLQAVLFAPTRAIGFIRPGQKVRLLYEAFPFQRFGAYSGHVVSVSQTILSEAGLPAPIQLKEPSYKVIASLDRPDVDANGQKVPLQAGMLLRADILLEKRKIISWLLNPILSARM